MIDFEKHLKLYPYCQEVDLVKLCYQAVFGPQHILTNLQNGRDFLIAECENNLYDNDEYYEEISDNLLRVHIGKNTKPDRLFNYLVLTAQTIKGDTITFLKEISNLKHYIILNNLKYDLQLIDHLTSYVSPVSHSTIYKEKYNPHYRVILRKLYMGEKIK